MVNVREGTNEELSPEIERQTCRKPVGEGKSMSDGYAMGLGVSSVGAVCAECVPMSTECSGRDDGGNWIDQFLMKDGAYNPNLDVASDTDFLPCRLQIVVIFVCRRNRTTARSVGILAHMKWSRENHQGGRVSICYRTSQWVMRPNGIEATLALGPCIPLTRFSTTTTFPELPTRARVL